MSDNELFFQEDVVISNGEVFLTQPPDGTALHLAYADFNTAHHANLLMKFAL
jgi:hypothetical protein